MHSNWHRAVLVSLLMIFTSLAGCIGTSDSDDKDENYGTIMTSTYHVEQLVSAIVGDTATVEMMSTTNIPVHDYTPSVIDMERLKDSDVFFYHGLELEPWVDSALSSEGVPPSYMTHTMPTGEITLDYQTMLVNALCEQLTSGDKESNNLLSYEDQAGQLEIHLEKGVQTLTFPPVDTERMEHIHDDDDHDDDHDDDDHDDDHDDDNHDGHGHEEGHDGHEGHAHAEAEMVIENPVNCPANTVISVFHLEEGEHVIEFETNLSTRTSFDVAALPMMGGHAHHHHDHGEEGHDDEHGVCHDMTDHTNNSIDNKADCEAGGYMWMEEDDGHDGHSDGDGHGGHSDNGHDDEMTAEHALEMADTNNDSSLSWDEFWAMYGSEHDHDDEGNETNNSSGNETDHGDHDGEMEMMEPYFMKLFNESDSDSNQLLNMSELETFIESLESLEDGSMSVEFILMLYDTDGDGGMSLEEYTSMFMISGDGQDHDIHHDEGNETDHNDNQTDNNNSGMEDLMNMMMEMIFNASDVNNDSILDSNELASMFTMDDDDDHKGPVCHEPATHNNTEQTDRASCEAAGNIWIIGEPNDGTRGYLTIHVENEGDYGFAMPSDVSVFLLKSEGHEDHGHGSHGEEGHGSHGDDDKVCYDMSSHTVNATHTNEEDCEAAGLMWTPANSGPGGEGGHDDDDHDSTLTADGDDDGFEYDPHSWLDPIAFKAQTKLVLDALIEVFPDGADTFTANAEVFMAELDKVHLGYVGAFGTGGTCTNKTAAANHNAYSYITERYGVEFVTVHGLDPEGQPSVEDIENVVSEIKEEELSVLFIEEYTQASSVDVITEETGIEVMFLYTMEKAPSDANDDYLSMLNKNLDNLKTGLGCAV